MFLKSFSSLKKIRRPAALVACSVFAAVLFAGCAAQTYKTRTVSGYSKNGTLMVTERVVVNEPDYGFYRQIESYDFQPHSDLPVAETGVQ